MMYTKICCRCKEEKPLEDFHNDKRKTDGKDSRCKVCKKKEARKEREDNYFQAFCRTKKSECKRKDIEFNLTAEHLEEIWTGYCRITGKKIEYMFDGNGSHHKTQAHLDRFCPDKGYTIGNVAWISGRVNRIKYNATVEELEAILKYMKEGIE